MSRLSPWADVAPAPVTIARFEVTVFSARDPRELARFTSPAPRT